MSDMYGHICAISRCQNLWSVLIIFLLLWQNILTRAASGKNGLFGSLVHHCEDTRWRELRAAGYITSAVKSKEQWTQGSKGSACFLLSYAIQDSLPREWSHPVGWVFPLSQYKCDNFSQTCPQVNLVCTVTYWDSLSWHSALMPRHTWLSFTISWPGAESYHRLWNNPSCGENCFGIKILSDDWRLRQYHTWITRDCTRITIGTHFQALDTQKLSDHNFA